MPGSRLLSAQLSAVEQHESAVPDKAAVHEMRVAIRRLRAALRVLGLKELDPQVMRLQDALGKVRDLQLQVDWLRGRDAALCNARAASLRGAEQGLGRELSRWRSEALPALLQAAGDSAASTHKVWKTLQTTLGELHDLDVRIELLKRKPALLRDQRELRKRLGEIASAQLDRWRDQHLVERAGNALR